MENIKKLNININLDLLSTLNIFKFICCKIIYIFSKIKINFNFFAIVFFLLLFISQNINCLFSQEIFESEGKKFWLTFLPNVHENTYTDSLYIFITSERPTQGTISYKHYDIKSKQWRDTVYKFQLTEANQMFTWGTRYFNRANNYSLELVSAVYNRSGISTAGTDVATISNKSFYIQADDKITVYALQCASKTAEACIVLPEPALGKEYYIMSYNSDYGDVVLDPTPSQFAIIATENNTNVTITQSCKIVWQGGPEKEPNTPHTILLNKGDVYLVQAYIDKKENKQNDLSGTHLVGNKPFAVFSGHVRATVPIEAVLSGDANNPSRDCLLEQMIPVHSWGKNAIVTPFVTPIGASTSPVNLKYKDFYRVMAAKDNTKIFINGTQVGSDLKAGSFIEVELSKPELITSNKPIMVVQYKKTNEVRYTGNNRSTGDPLMLVVPPVEQFKKTYNIISPQMAGDSFIEQYLTIVASDSSTNKINLDGVILSNNIFAKVPNSDFSYAQIKTKDGGHRITCEDPISVQVYGYGYAISYGYLGGMSFKDLEKNKIHYGIDTCYTTANFIYNETFSSGIKFYQVLDSTNCTIKENYLSPKNLQLSVTKKNIYEDAFFTIKIVDIYDEETIISDTIFSYSIKILGVKEEDNNSINFDFGDCKIGAINEYKFQIANLGTIPVFVDNNMLKFSHKEKFTISQQKLPISLMPKDTLDIHIYYAPTNSTKYKIMPDSIINNLNSSVDYDTLKISEHCGGITVYLEGTPYSDTLDFTSKCGVAIRAVADTIDLNTEIGASMDDRAPVIYPNPASMLQAVFYRFEVVEKNKDMPEEIEISIQSINGVEILPILKTSLKAGTYEIELPIKDLLSGSYLVSYKSKTKIKTSKFVIL